MEGWPRAAPLWPELAILSCKGPPIATVSWDREPDLSADSGDFTPNPGLTGGSLLTARYSRHRGIDAYGLQTDHRLCQAGFRYSGPKGTRG